MVSIDDDDRNNIVIYYVHIIISYDVHIIISYDNKYELPDYIQQQNYTQQQNTIFILSLPLYQCQQQRRREER